MNIKLWLACALVGAGFFFWGGWYARQRLAETPAPIAVEQSMEKATTQIKTIIRTVTVKEPAADGRDKVTTTTESTSLANTVDQTAKVDSNPVPTIVPYRPDWSVSVHVAPRLDSDVYKPTGATVGYRVLGNAWIEGGFDWRYHEPTVGVRVEF